MSIPARFRRVIQDQDPDYEEGERPQFVIVYGGPEQKFLKCYPVAEMEKLEANIKRLPNSRLKREMINTYISLTVPGEVDPDGRIVIPQEQREKINLTSEAKFVGALETFEIWDPAAHDANLAGDEDESEDLGFGIPQGTDLLDAMDMALAQLDGG